MSSFGIAPRESRIRLSIGNALDMLECSRQQPGPYAVLQRSFRSVDLRPGSSCNLDYLLLSTMPSSPRRQTTVTATKVAVAAAECVRLGFEPGLRTCDCTQLRHFLNARGVSSCHICRLAMGTCTHQSTCTYTCNSVELHASWALLQRFFFTQRPRAAVHVHTDSCIIGTFNYMHARDLGTCSSS